VVRFQLQTQGQNRRESRSEQQQQIRSCLLGSQVSAHLNLNRFSAELLRAVTARLALLTPHFKKGTTRQRRRCQRKYGSRMPPLCCFLLLLFWFATCTTVVWASWSRNETLLKDRIFCSTRDSKLNARARAFLSMAAGCEACPLSSILAQTSLL